MRLSANALQELVHVLRFSCNIGILRYKLCERGLDNSNVKQVNISRAVRAMMSEFSVIISQWRFSLRNREIRKRTQKPELLMAIMETMPGLPLAFIGKFTEKRAIARGADWNFIK